MALHGARARVRSLAAAVAAEEGSLVQTTLAAAEETAAAERQQQGSDKQAAVLRGARPTEQRLRARVAQTEQLLRKEHDVFKALLNDDSIQLALAVEANVDNYFTDVRTLRRRGNPAHGAQAAAQAGTAVRKLEAEKSRLAEAVRSLGEEREALASQARVIERSKQTLVDALHRRDALRSRHAY